MRLFTFIAVLFFGFIASAQTVDDFVFEVDLTNSPSTAYSFKLDTASSVTVDWGDGTSDNYFNNTSSNQPVTATHNYSSQAVYTVFINNQLDTVRFSSDIPLTITQWGTSVWKTMFNTFTNCENLTISTTDTPDLSLVTSMSIMFKGASNFNSDISNWDVSGVTNMSEMFSDATSFNQPLDGWDVSNVVIMHRMFYDATSFNQSLNSWNVSSVTDMEYMFLRASTFNQPLNNWNVSSVTKMSYMFTEATSFNSDISTWDVSSVTNMRNMFEEATDFNQPIDNWDVSGVTNMNEMFHNAISFDQSLNNWNISSVSDMGNMFWNATSFNQPLNNWDLSNATEIIELFRGATSFNQPLDGWDVSNVSVMNAVFNDATSFNQPLNNWDVSGVTEMRSLFNGATSFDQPLNTWDVSSVTTMSFMFYNSSSFNQDISSWNFNNTVDLTFFISSSGLDVNNYDALLQRFVQLNLPYNSMSSSSFRVNGLEYCDVLSRAALIQDGWNFQGDTLSSSCSNATTDEFVFSVETTGQYIYSFQFSATGTVTIDWGDGTTDTFTNVTDQGVFHSYPSSFAVYTIIINNQLDSFKFSRDNPLTIIQWGTSTWQTMFEAFSGCANLTITANDAPDLSQVTDMSYMFYDAPTFNSDISNWDVSNVTDMSYMFTGGNASTDFNQPLNNWDVSNVTNMNSMFHRAFNFNQPLNNWDVSNVTDMSYMFSQTSSYNQPLALWDVSNVTDMSHMFNNASSFNQNISNWVVSSVLDMSNMFSRADVFNQPLNSWNVSNVTDMSSMFASTSLSLSSFNQPLSNWDVSSVTDMSNMFNGANVFNQPLNIWDVSSVTNMSGMFYEASVFNQPLNTWDVSSVTNMSNMFYEASVFNQPLNTWNVSNVTDMSNMFGRSNSFDQLLNSWDVSSVTSMRGMFSGATDFNQLLDSWDVSNVTSMRGMFSGATSFNLDISSWDVSSVTDMRAMFQGATSFNQPLNTWDVSGVMRMTSINNFVSFFNSSEGMFEDATSFNQPLNSWDVSGVTEMNGMFKGATSFNQPLDNWDVSNVFRMNLMFNDAISFNQDLSSWNFNQFISSTYFVSGSGLDIDNYDALLQRYVQLNVSYTNSGSYTFNASGLEYCDSFSREILIQNGWPIVGDTLSSSCPNTILSGNVLYDFDLNGCDPSDFPAQNMAITITDGTNELVVYTIDGQYSVNLPDDNFTLTPEVNSNLFISTPPSVSVTIAGGANQTQDFCLTATTPVDDLEITILPLEDARPGFDTNYKLIYKNKGNTRLSGSVNFTYEDDFMNFLTANPATTSSSTGMLSWDFVNLDPFETREIEFTMNLNAPTDPAFPLNSNDLLDFSATINPTANDDTPLDNVFDLQQTVVNSYDPNDKTCLQGETILPTMVGEYVHYRIRFENEGTASAVNVKIVDYIDTSKFDIATLKPLSASHDYTTTITEGNKVEFLFDNINLPFTAPASQGYVLFKIKTVDTLVLGDDFTNQAEIYFDFNFPIITNLETTTVAVPLNINDSNLLEVSLYPNPAQNTVSLTSNLAFNEYTIYDTLGAIVLQQKLDSPTLSQDILVDHLVSGLYFVEVKGDQSSSVLKLIKE